MAKWCWRKAFGLRSPYVALPTEIAPGVIRPSYALAGMVAGIVIKNANNVDSYRVWDQSDWDRKIGKSVRCPVNLPTEYTSYTNEKRVKCLKTVLNKKNVIVLTINSLPYLYIDGTSYNGWETEDKRIVSQAFDKAAELRKEFEESAEKIEKQKKATDLIESLFGEKEENKTEYEYLPCDCDSGCSCCKVVKGCSCSICVGKRSGLL